MAQTSACVRAAAHSEIAAAISAQMITGIVRNAQAVRFAYDRTYQLVSERGQYTNATAGQIAAVANRFAYDRAGNRVSHSSSLPAFHSSSYRHTAAGGMGSGVLLTHSH